MSLGQIKDYTPNFNLIIPRFDIATWHDYMESNFRSIDALFFNMFGINQYRGEWQNSTTYQVGDVLFIGDPNSQYTGRLVKVLVIHTTTANDSFDVYYAHNPINYDMFMDAAAAEQAAKLARDWAIKTDGKVQDLDYSSKYYANLITPISSEIVNVSNISNEVVNVSNISTNIENVNTISTDIIAVSNKLNEITTNSNNISSIIINSNNINDINTTATNINSINNVSSISSSVNSVANNVDNIQDIVNNETNIMLNAINIEEIITNATNIDNIITVSNSINQIIAVDNNKNNINSVAAKLTDINSVANNINNVINVSNNETNINSVATNSTNINTAAININAINTAANNIVAIQNASANAQLARDWAVKMDGLVSGEDYSAKYWADQARQSAAGAVVDNISINRNTDDELQTIGVINQNNITSAIKTWTGTKAQYDAIITKDTNTLYNIIDDTQASTYEAYSKSETDTLLANSISTLLSNLYPIGSIYIGTQTTCPLATLISGSTWELVAQNRALWGGDGTNANTTIAAGLPNITGTITSNNWAGLASDNSALYPSGNGRNSTESGNGQNAINIDASRSNSIYGNSNTVQPPAYRVNIWRRTA